MATMTQTHTHTLTDVDASARALSHTKRNRKRWKIQYRFVAIGTQHVSLFVHFRRRGFIQVPRLAAAAHRFEKLYIIILFFFETYYTHLYFFLNLPRSFGNWEFRVCHRHRRRSKIVTTFWNTRRRQKKTVSSFQVLVAFLLNVIVYIHCSRGSRWVRLVFFSFRLWTLCGPTKATKLWLLFFVSAKSMQSIAFI